MSAAIGLTVKPGINSSGATTTVFEVDAYLAGELSPHRVNVAKIALRTLEEVDALIAAANRARTMMLAGEAGDR